MEQVECNLLLGLLILFSFLQAVNAEEKLAIRTGYLAKMISQHPLNASPFQKEFYFNLGEQNSIRQIIVRHPVAMPVPNKADVKIELTGFIETIYLGGKAATKMSYSNQVMTLKSWRYLEQPGMQICWYAPKPSQLNLEPEFSQHKDCANKNDAGKLQLNPKHQAQLDYGSNHLAIVRFDGRFYYVHQNGACISTISFDNWADEFQDGLARSQINGKMGYFNQALKLVIPAEYDWAFPFENGVAVVCKQCRLQAMGEHNAVVGGLWGKINRQGEVIETLSSKK